MQLERERFNKFALQVASAIDHVTKSFDLTDNFIRVTCFTPDGSTMIQQQLTQGQSEPLGWIWYVEQLEITSALQNDIEFKAVNQLEARDEWIFSN